MAPKLGKNAAKRAAAAQLAELDTEMSEEQRQAMLQKGMGVGGGLHKGEDELFEKKMSKEEKKVRLLISTAAVLAASSITGSGRCTASKTNVAR